MASMIEWYGSNESIPQSDITLFALPGVGDVGKTAIENIKESMDCELIARVLNSGFPPHATLDSDGLITPPHIEISLSRSNSKSILLIWKLLSVADLSLKGKVSSIQKLQ